MTEKGSNRYTRLIESVFQEIYKPRQERLGFSRSQFADEASKLGVDLPKNLGDILYTFRYRAGLPSNIVKTAPKGKEWVIRAAGRGLYEFALVHIFKLEPSNNLAVTKILDSTPGLIEKYALSDEQALLAKIRYNRLIDIFTGLTCFSLQNHLRTSVSGLGQIETDELYIGLNKQGSHFVLPIQAKGAKDKIGRVQIEQDIALCREKFKALECRPIAAQFMKDKTIALFQLEAGKEIKLVSEKHYRLVSSSNLSEQELLTYSRRLD